MNNNTRFWREYMCMRVRLDVKKSLKTGKKIKVNGVDWCIVSFKYEKLEAFCVVCGVLGR